MAYQIPPNINRIVRNDRKKQQLIELLAEEDETGCSLQKKCVSDIGCSALPQQLCYLVKGTEKHPQVLSRDECPVYQKVRELLY